MTNAIDFRFEITEYEEPEYATHRVRVIERIVVPEDEFWPCPTVIDGEVIADFDSNDPYGEVEAAREVQCIPMEERWAMYAERGW